jgi:O-antigen/teichoic acid export membrane protein
MPYETFKEKIIKNLRVIEKYTKTDMVYLAREGFWSLFGQSIGSMCSFVVVVLLANILPKEVFGQYRFILSVLSIFILFTLPGIGTSLIRSVARNNVLDLSKIVKIKILWGFLGSIGACVMSAYYLSKGNMELVSVLVLVTFFLPFIEPFSIYSSYYKGKQDFKMAEIYEAISRIFEAIILVVVAIVTQNILAILAAYLVGQIIARFFFYQKTLRSIEMINTSTVVDNTNETILYGKYLTATQIIGTITTNIDKLIVWHFLGAEILAIYYIALTIPRNLVLICNIIPRVAFPKFSQNTWELNERFKIIHKLLIFLGLLTIVALFYSSLVPFVIPLIFKNYIPSVPAAVIFGFLIILSPVNATIDRILQAMKAVKKIIVLQTFSLIIFIGIFLLLNESSDISATTAAISLVASEMMSFLVGIWFVRWTKVK